MLLLAILNKRGIVILLERANDKEEINYFRDIPLLQIIFYVFRLKIHSFHNVIRNFYYTAILQRYNKYQN